MWLAFWIDPVLLGVKLPAYRNTATNSAPSRSLYLFDLAGAPGLVEPLRRMRMLLTFLISLSSILLFCDECRGNGDKKMCRHIGASPAAM